ncbi:MAG: 16S rRNA (adenine(1518)-N(6)/adenine(1519)-N(6))-dimethyltransferase RsmA [Bacillota bacterium]|nr:16S rRNA (adenine(1518)-N(6)/adenine(1519)-N(6))-dimethyltransferase RsmA [Bacillota bacterium]
MEKLCSPGEILRLSEKYGIRSSKSLGQNFLADGNIVGKIMESSAPGPGDLVIEVGPGFGVLTAAAAARGAAVAAVEIDRSLQPVLEESLAGFSRVRLFWQDILKADIRAIAEAMAEGEAEPFKSIKVLGNLPYYITTPVVMKLLEEMVSWDRPWEPPVDSFVFMMQKEVADRIRALPGTRACGAISAAVQYRCTVDLVAAVPREVFLPRPKVDSAVLRLNVRKERPPALSPKNERLFLALIRKGFGQRRKTLANALNGLEGLEKAEIAEGLKKAGIDPVRRAESLSLEEFVRAADAIYEIKGEQTGDQE